MTYPEAASRLARWVPVYLWAALLVQGCATTAPATAWRPAEIDVDGIQRLSVLEFSGESGQAVAAALTTKLWENEFYALVDHSELTPLRTASTSATSDPIQPAAYLDSARGRQVDGIIVGDVIEYRCDDQVLTNTDVRFGTGRSKDHRHGIEHEGLDMGVSQNQSVHREATVSIAFRLVEVDSGKVRATRKTTHNFQGDFASGSGPIPAMGEVLDELTQRCVEDFVAMLAPHEVNLRMPLARSHLFQRGQALVGKGNDFAKRGRWDEATAAWTQALEANPDNDAARYNLAVASAAQHDYSTAEEHAIRAINVKHKDLYADGLETIRRLAADHDAALRQRQQTGMAGTRSRERHLSLSE